MDYLVYIIEREDGLKYIGTTNSARLRKRMIAHKSSKRFKNYRWVYEILYKSHIIDDCYQKEEELIKYYDTYNNGLNESENGRGKNNCKTFTTRGYKFSQESRKKMSETRKRKIALGEIFPTKNVWSDEMKQHFSNIRKNKQHSTKVTLLQVNEMRALYEQQLPIEGVGKIMKNGLPLSYLQAFSKKYSSIYGITAVAIRKIIKKETWNGAEIKFKI